MSISGLPKLRDQLELYETEPDLRKKHIQRQLKIFDEERTPRETAADKVMTAISAEPLKLNAIMRRIREGSSLVSVGSVEGILGDLVSSGKVERTKYGYYRKT